MPSQFCRGAFPSLMMRQLYRQKQSSHSHWLTDLWLFGTSTLIFLVHFMQTLHYGIINVIHTCVYLLLTGSASYMNCYLFTSLISLFFPFIKLWILGSLNQTHKLPRLSHSLHFYLNHNYLICPHVYSIRIIFVFGDFILLLISNNTVCSVCSLQAAGPTVERPAGVERPAKHPFSGRSVCICVCATDLYVLLIAHLDKHVKYILKKCGHEAGWSRDGIMTHREQQRWW